MIALLVTLVVLGLAFWCLTLLPIAEPFIKIIKVVLILIAVVYILNFFGIYTGFPVLH